MIKKLLKDSVIHIQYWFLKELKRSLALGKPLSSIFRYYPKYMSSNLDYSKSPLVLGIPWITFEAIDYLNEIIKSDMKVFEFGSGGSTKFFTKRVAEVTSVEHDQRWYEKIKQELGEAPNLNLILVEGKQFLPNYEQIVYDEEDDNLDYWDYSRIILNFKDDYFDLILIDGKARNACIMNSLNKLKPGGILILDNSHRISYQDSLINLKGWLLLKSFGPTVSSKKFTETSFFQKP